LTIELLDNQRLVGVLLLLVQRVHGRLLIVGKFETAVSEMSWPLTFSLNKKKF
jgi:hypothetical protein